LRGCVLAFTAIVVLFVWNLVHQSLPAWSTYGWSIISGTQWNPAALTFGALPIILDTLISAGVAVIIAVPIGLGTALAINFVIPRRLKTVASALVELLAAVPSVCYGLWGLLVVAPWMATTFEPWLASLTGGGWPFSGDNLGSGLMLASIILSIMILPTIVAVTREVIAAVPGDLTEAALSLGATKSQALRKVVLPSARVGMLGAVSLGAGRALGETIAVAMVIGGNAQMPHSLFSVGATIASTIAAEYTEATPQAIGVLAALAVILMAITVLVNAGARGLVIRAERGAR
jgi:phosphate transport system permease protein